MRTSREKDKGGRGDPHYPEKEWPLAVPSCPPGGTSFSSGNTEKEKKGLPSLAILYSLGEEKRGSLGRILEPEPV